MLVLFLLFIGISKNKGSNADQNSSGLRQEIREQVKLLEEENKPASKEGAEKKNSDEANKETAKKGDAEEQDAPKKKNDGEEAEKKETDTKK